METILITDDMIGDLFMTRGGKIVRLTRWWNGAFPARFTDGFYRRKDGCSLIVIQ